MLTPRASQLQAERIMNIWTVAEMGDRRAKKSHKKSIKRQRRTLEKRAVRNLNNYTKERF